DLLHGRLKRSPARLITGTEIRDIAREHGQGVIIDRQLGRHGPFDLVVVADGAHSAIRRRLMPEAYQKLYPWGGIWATAPDSAGIGGGGLLRQRVRGTRLMMGLLPVGDNQLTIYWSLPTVALAPHESLDLEAIRRTAAALWPETTRIFSEAGEFSRAT